MMLILAQTPLYLLFPITKDMMKRVAIMVVSAFLIHISMAFLLIRSFTHLALFFSSQGYADLTAAQLYALLQSLLHSFDFLNPYKGSKHPCYLLTTKQLQSEIFENNSTSFNFFMTDSHIKSIVDSEVYRLQGQKSPYKSAF